MVNEKSSEELYHGRSEYDRKRALNQMSSSSSPISEKTAGQETTAALIGQPIDSDHLYPPLKRSLFKDCKAVLDELLEQIENDRLLEPPSLIKFKEQSISLIGDYMDSAWLDHNRAVERSKQRSECASDEISRRLRLFTRLKNDYEDLEADLLEYLGY